MGDLLTFSAMLTLSMGIYITFLSLGGVKLTNRKGENVTLVHVAVCLIMSFLAAVARTML